MSVEQLMSDSWGWPLWLSHIFHFILIAVLVLCPIILVTGKMFKKD